MSNEKLYKEQLEHEKNDVSNEYSFLAKDGSAYNDDHENEAKDTQYDIVGPLKSSKFYKSTIDYKINTGVKVKPELQASNTILSVRNLKQFFFFKNGLQKSKLKAVSNISFDIKEGECLGLVGESGCGKTTTGRSIIKLYDITSGSVYYKGYRISAGDRWNRKEIKFTNIRKREGIKKFNKECKDEIAKLDPKSSKYVDECAQIKAKYANLIDELVTRSKAIVTEQKSKIKQIKYDNKHVNKKLVNEIQMIFQDPIDSLDPRMTVEDIIQEGLKIQGIPNVKVFIAEQVKAIKEKAKEAKAKLDEAKEKGNVEDVEKYTKEIMELKKDYKKAKSYDIREARHKMVVDALNRVGLVEDHASRYPHEFSGGQRQRIGIARALIMNPKLLICDEPISALDVSIRAQIINLLNELKEELGLTILFIAHDLSVVKYFCDRIAVMYFGKIVELADSDELFRNPLHPYTKSLLSAIPKPDPKSEKNRTRITYNPQESHDYSVNKPELREIKPGHFVYCSEEELERYKLELK